MVLAELQTGFLEDAVQRAGRESITGLARHGDATRPGRVLALAMGARVAIRNPPSAWINRSIPLTFLPAQWQGRLDMAARRLQWGMDCAPSATGVAKPPGARNLRPR